MVLDNLAFKIDDNGNKTNINFQKLRLTNKQLDFHKSRTPSHNDGKSKGLQILGTKKQIFVW
jgi:hypothetical protein